MRMHEPLPPARTIDAHAIVQAYVEGNVYEANRINMYQGVGMSQRARIRRMASLTQGQLASLANLPGIHGPQICMWERGQIEFGAPQLARIAGVLHKCITRTPIPAASADELVKVLTSNPVSTAAA